MWSSRLFWKVFLVYAGLSVAMGAGFWAIVTWRQKPLVEERVQERLRDTAMVLRKLVGRLLTTEEERDELQSTVRQLAVETQTRLTVLGASGAVLADSHEDPQRMENHADRPEIQSARRNGAPGTDQRSSSTTHIATYYLALPVRQGGEIVGYVRVGAELRTIRDELRTMQQIALTAVVSAVFLSLAATYLIVRRIIQPLDDLTRGVVALGSTSPPRPVAVTGRDEVALLGAAFNAMQDQLAQHLAELHENNSRLSNVMENMAEGVLAVDASERIVLANEASRRLLDIGTGEIIGRPLWEVTRQRVLVEAVGEALRTGRPSAREFETGTASRRVLTLRATRLASEPTLERTLSSATAGGARSSTAGSLASHPTLPSQHGSGSAAGVSGGGSNIDGAGGGLVHLAAGLGVDGAGDGDVRESGGAGVMMVLHDVSDLRRLENLRREFVANVSHELKTPLSSIKAYAETLRMGAVNDPEHNLAFVARIEEQADRLHQLILDLLQLARVESGQEAYDIVTVPLAEIVDHCFGEYQPVAAAKNVVLDVERTDADLCVRADEEGLLMIVNNLVDNAIKYTPEGGRVTIRWRRDGSQAVLEVQDTGIGIPKQHQSRVFERFYRVDKARSRELGGTGLGLSIVKHLAQAFGGNVGLESQPRVGSTFRVHLPVAAAV